VPLLRRLVRYHRLKGESGVLAVQIEPASPASAADLRQGDIIVEFDDSVVGRIDDLHRLLTEERVGKPCPVVILRGTEKITLNITPREMPRRS